MRVAKWQARMGFAGWQRLGNKKQHEVTHEQHAVVGAGAEAWRKRGFELAGRDYQWARARDGGKSDSAKNISVGGGVNGRSEKDGRKGVAANARNNDRMTG